MAIWYLKKRDTAPTLVVTLKDPAGAAIDLTGSTVYLHVYLSDGTKLKRAMVVDASPATGIARYTWLAADWGPGASADADGSFTVGGLIVSPGSYPSGTFVLTSGAYEHRMEYEIINGLVRLTCPNDGYDTLRCVADIGQA